MDKKEAEDLIRHELKEAGWKQGVILEPEGISDDKDTIGFLVISQTCDCINPNFVKEPYLELLPLKKRNTKKGNPDPDFVNGKNPREIHFSLEIGSQEACVVGKISEIIQKERERHDEYTLSDIEISQSVLDGVIGWRAYRYLRHAFPDGFENALSSIKKEMKGYIEDEELNPAIASILINLTPHDREVEESEPYEVHLLLLVKKEHFGYPDLIEKLSELAKNITNLLGSVDLFDEPTCKIYNMDEISMEQGSKYLDFTRYDYLSFGED